MAASSRRVIVDSAVGDSERIFVGREAELVRLRAALATARAGRPQLVVVEGPEGIGKTTLVRRALEAGTDLQVLQASGAEREVALAFGVVDQLISGVGVSLPEQLTELGKGDGWRADPLAVGAALVDLLGALQREGPVALVVDDAQWADTPSLSTLAFVFRRLRSERMLALVCARDAAAIHLPEGLRRTITGPSVLRLRLPGLDNAALGRLARGLGRKDLSTRALRNLHHHTEGNPLYVCALLEELPAETLRDGTKVLPAPRSVALLIADRLAGCPSKGASLTMAAAVLGVTCQLEVAAQLAEVGEPLVALEQAIAARLLQEWPGGQYPTITFPHPLVRAAVYWAIGPARRAAMHTRAATLVDGETVALQHRVLAASGTDSRLAEQVTGLARRRAGMGAWAGAAEGLATAARLTGSGPMRERLLLETVECLLLAGDVGEAAVLRNQITARADVGWRDYIAGRLAAVSGQIQEAEMRLTAAWRLRDPTKDRALGARVAGLLASLCILGLRGLEGARWVERACELDPTATACDLIHALGLIGLGLAGRSDEALARTAGLPDPASSVAELDALLGRAFVRTWTDDLAGAYRDLAGLAVAQDMSAPFRGLALTALSQVEYRRGLWDDALAHAERAVSLLTATGQRWLAPIAHATAVPVLAARGAWGPAAMQISAGWATASHPLCPGHVVYLATADAHVHTARSDPSAVLGALQPVLALHRDGIDEPGVVPWHDLLVNALVGLGDHARAQAQLDQVEARAADRRRHSTLVAAARARGNLEAARGNRPAAERAFQAGVAAASEIEEPFLRALLEASYGSFLRRCGKRAAAAGHLHAAREILTTLEARPYLDRCERELASCGLTPVKRRMHKGTRLTPQELAVARLVAGGMTNREAAAELVVSVKTVEYHLSKVYGKLGLRSRSQLLLRLLEDQD